MLNSTAFLMFANVDGMTDADLIELVSNSAYPELIEEHTE